MNAFRFIEGQVLLSDIGENFKKAGVSGHIEKLANDWQHLSSIQKLSLQIQTFEKYIDLAIAHHLPSMVVIHGIGTGKLKEELHEILKYRKDVKSFVNQYDPRYGYGATEIFFQY